MLQRAQFVITMPRSELVGFLGGALVAATITGCLSGVHSSPRLAEPAIRSTASDQWEAHHSRLLRHGRFSEAALLAGLHDHHESGSAMESLQKSVERSPEPAPALGSSPLGDRPPLADPSGEVPDSLAGKAMQQTPSASLDESWHLQMGWTFLIHGNYDGAIAAYREALRHNDKLPQAFLGLGIALRVQGKNDAAKSAMQRALALAPRYAAALVHLGYLYADGSDDRDYAKARQLFQLASRLGDPFAAIALRDLDARERT